MDFVKLKMIEFVKNGGQTKASNEKIYKKEEPKLIATSRVDNANQQTVYNMGKQTVYNMGNK